MSKTKLTAAEWEIVRDAPYWVFAGLAAADNKQAIITNRKESSALDDALENYKSSNALIRDVLANEEKADKEIKKASMFDVEQALGKISQIVETKLGSNDLDAFNDFLLDVAKQVAESAGEKVLGLGENISKREAVAMENMTKALRATDTDKRARRQEEQRQAAEAKRAADEKAKREAAARAQKEAEEKARREAEAKARQEAEAKAKREAEARAKKLSEERAAKAAALAQEQAAKLEAKRKADEAKREAAAQAAEAAKYIGEHTVVSGDNLSYISKQYYGSTAHWKLIYEENKAIIGDNPNLIRVGQVFKIPTLPEG